MTAAEAAAITREEIWTARIFEPAMKTLRPPVGDRQSP
jgi:hypothetical protein